jgi:hypothetical protein
LDREQEEEAYKSQVYVYKEIQEVCRDLALNFLPARDLVWCDTDFKYELVEEIEKYCSRLSNNMGLDHESNNFFALSVEESFSNSSKFKKSSAKKEPQLMLFYRTNAEKKTFVHIKTWGETKYSNMRYIKAWRKRSPLNKFVSDTLLWSGAIYIVASIATSGASLFASVFAGLVINATRHTYPLIKKLAS